MIQIIDGFKLNASTPIDSRIVVADDAERTNITYLYHGLRVWQRNTNTPWFYDGTQWVSELDLVVTGTASSTNIIPKVTSTNPLQINDSQISDNGTTVNINNNLTVGTNITFSGNLIGTINADNITTGTLLLNRLEGGTSGQVLQMSSSSPTWVNLSSLSIGTSNSSNTVKITGTNTTDEYRLVLMKDGSTLGSSNQLYSKNNGIKIKEDSGGLRILAHVGAVDKPPYSFDASPTSGIYYNSGIYLSINGANKTKIDSTGLKFGLGSVVNPSLSGFDSITYGTPGGSATKDLSKTGFFYTAYFSNNFGSRAYFKFTDNNSNSISLNELGLFIHSSGYNYTGLIFSKDSSSGDYSSIYTNPDRNQLNFNVSENDVLRLIAGSNQFNGNNYLYGATRLESNAGTFEVINNTSNKNIKTALFKSGNNEINFVPNAGSGGFNLATIDGDSIIWAEDSNALVIGHNPAGGATFNQGMTIQDGFVGIGRNGRGIGGTSTMTSNTPKSEKSRLYVHGNESGTSTTIAGYGPYVAQFLQDGYNAGGVYIRLMRDIGDQNILRLDGGPISGNSYRFQWRANGSKYEYSDRRAKDNIITLGENALDKVLKLNPVTYTMKLDSTIQTGFIAQEVLEVIPQVVGVMNPDLNDGDDHYGIHYERMIPFLTKAIQEQQKQIEQQAIKIYELEDRLTNL